ncbi:hypothetical protein DFP74_0568 [Nocardiopsis sp. Huas11]|uniref:pilin n=1 Tax=Nocardiopsis sp. Huas11 TaxID=2183912 RepID=UPI000F1E3E10|nr:pilin [Nocardiopsis sp. Huas11]RKS04988.1 hypothetical protein DFP74_0568 [Nocardiopsis sp. Huas11]
MRASVRGASWRRVRWQVVAVAAVAVWWVAVGDEAAWVWAETADEESAATQTAELRRVVDRIRLVIIALASALGTLFLTIAGVRWLAANGEPGQIDGAKRALSGAAIGYGIAILATVLMDILDWIVSVGATGSGG